MKKFDLESESQKWEHPYRIQMTNPLSKHRIISMMNKYYQGSQYAVEKRGNKFVLWRKPEQKWDVDDATPEWIQEWTSQKPPPPWKAFIEFVTKNGEKEIMPTTDNRFRRDEAIRAEFAEYKRQGFQSGHIYRVLAEKFYLSPHRVRDIIVLTREKRLKPPK